MESSARKSLELSLPPQSFVWLIFAVFALTQIVVALTTNTWLPRFDDWYLVKSYIGWSQGNTSALFEPLEVHVIPAPKLIIFTIWDLFGVHLSATGLVSALLLALFAGLAIMILPHPVDKTQQYFYVFFPLMLLGLSPFHIVTWGTGLTMTLFYGLSVIILLLLYGEKWRQSRSVWHCVWALLLIVMTVYTSGLIFGLVVSIFFLAYVLTSDVRQDKHRLASSTMWFIAIVAYAAFVLSLNSTEITSRRSLDREYFALSISAIVTFVQVLATPLFRVGERLWPVSGVVVGFFWLITLPLIISSFVNGKKGERWLAAAIVAYACVALAISLGRSWQGGFALRYGMLFGGMYIAAFLLWTNRKAGELVQFSLCLTAAAIALWTQGESFRLLREYRDWDKSMIADAEQGMPLLGLAITNRLGAEEEELRGLKNLNKPWFARLADNPSWNKVQIDPTSVRWHRVERQTGSVVQTSGPLSYGVFAPPPGRKVYAVILEYTHRSHRNGIAITVRWLRSGDQPVFERLGERTIAKTFWLPSFRVGSMDKFWIGEQTELIAFWPDIVPCEFELRRLELLVD